MKPKLSDIVKLLKQKANTSDTLFVSDPKDKRLKSYQDSLMLFNRNIPRNFINKVLKQGVYTKSNPSEARGEIKPVESYRPNNELMDIFNTTGVNYDYVSPIITKENSSKFYKDSEGIVRDRKTNSIITNYINNYKKPVQPIKYKKSEPKKEEKKAEPVKKEQPKPAEKKKNIYDGSPVYSPGAGSGMPSALVGFRNKSGDTTYIKPEDYERFAVPKYGKAFIESKSKKK